MSVVKSLWALRGNDSDGVIVAGPRTAPAVGHPGVDTPKDTAHTDSTMKSARTTSSSVLVLIH